MSEQRQAFIDARRKLGVSERRACLVTGTARATMRYHGVERDDDVLRLELIQLVKQVGIEPIDIYPEAQRENGYNERFNGTLRNEILNANWLHVIHEAQVTINCWRKEYNHIMPHQALDMRPPIPETTTLKLVQTSGA